MNFAHAEPVASRRQEHRASRRGPCTPPEIEPSQVFRLLCALIRAELRAHPALNWREGYTDLVEHMKTAAVKAQLPYGQDKLTRALEAIERSEKPRAPKRAEPVRQVQSTPRPRHAINAWRCCGAEHERFMCTLPPNHDGEHIATTCDESSPEHLTGEVRARWCATPTQCDLRAAKEAGR
jgi:hypothetical protein